MSDFETPIDDDEIVLRLIPASQEWFEPPDRIKSSCFTLRHDEAGISVFRARFMSPQRLREVRHASSEARVSEARVGDIRNAVNGRGDPLGLDVIPVDAGPEQPGHSEIRGNITKAASKALRDLFRIVDEA